MAKEISRRDLLTTVRDLVLAGIASQVLPGRVEAGGEANEAETKEVRIKTPAIVGAVLLFTRLDSFSYILPHGGVEGLSVELYPGSIVREGGRVISFGTSDYNPVATAVTGKDGTFIFEDLKPAELYIVLLASVRESSGDETAPYGYDNEHFIAVKPGTQIAIVAPFRLGISDLPEAIRKKLGFYTVYSPHSPSAAKTP